LGGKRVDEGKASDKWENISLDTAGFEEAIARLKEEEAEFMTLATRRSGGELILWYYFRTKGKVKIIQVQSVDNSVPSLYSSFRKADFIEREINNTFGVKFLGHPNLGRIPGKEDTPPKESFFRKKTPT
jgi:NADH:ubiquinone oxidoreductase subunit C